MGYKGVKIMGLFGDIFEDDDFEISSEEEEIELELEEDIDDWGTPKKSRGATWDTGNKPDIWNADEPWTCDDDCDPKCVGGDCGPDTAKKSFDVDDFFS